MTGRTATATIMVTDAQRSASLVEVIGSHRGRIVAEGELVIAAFDAASDAVDTAMDLPATFRGHGEESTWRVGIAAGDVSWDGLVCRGAAVDIAGALHRVAGGGQVVVGSAVRLLAGDPTGDGYVRAGTVSVPGIPGRVETYRLRVPKTLAGLALAPPMPLALGRRVSHEFVGRSEAMADLLDVWGDAQVGAGRIVLIGGEAGAGKTRLATELARELHHAGGCVLYGGCDDDLALPYQPWVQATDQLLESAPDDLVSDEFAARLAPIAPLVSRLEHLLPEGTRVSPDAGVERFRTYGAFAAMLAETASRWPTLVVLEDLHWAGPQTLALLRHVARSGLPPRILVLGTFRDSGVDVSEPLASCLADLRRVDGVTRMRLQALDSEAIEHLVGSALDEPVLGPDLRELARRVAERSGGNAFFVGELWRHFLDTGVVALRDDGWVVNDSPNATAVPEGVREVVTARLIGLSATARRVAELASLSGQSVEHSVLSHAAALDASGLSGAVDELVARGLIAATDGSVPTCRFEHAIVRDTVEAEIPPLSRGRLHLALAEAIEAVYESDRRPVLAELARHFAGASQDGQRGKVMYYGRRAARQAFRSAAYEEAVAHLEPIVDVGPDNSERAEALVELGSALLRLGSFEASRDACHRAFELAAHLGASTLAARAAVGFEQAVHFPGLPGGPAVELLRRGLALVGDEPSPVRATVMASLGRALALDGRLGEGISTAEAAVTLARELDDPETLAAGLQTLSIILDNPQRSLMVGDELAELAERLNDPWSFAYATGNQLRNHVVLGQMDRAADALVRHCAVSSTGRFSTFRFLTEALGAVLAVAAGDFAGAEAAAGRAAVAGAAADAPFDAGVYGLQMYAIRRAQGRLAEVAPVLRALTASADPPPMWRPGLAALYVDVGMLTEAREVFESLAPNQFGAVPRDTVWSACLTFLAETCIAIADRQQAAVLYRELLRFRGLNLMAGLTMCFGPADRLLGGLAELLGRPSDADDHFSGALELSEASASPVWTAEAQFDWAGALAARGDTQRAHVLGQAAIATAKRLGMGRLSGRAVPGEPATHLSHTTTPAKPMLPCGLSEREAEVLRLVADGLSNRQIGDHLYISQHTVANHVRAILQKSSSANRAEAASFAVRRGLVDA